MIKLITGPMFSGKSEALIDEYEKNITRVKILLFKPALDTRDLGVIKTRNNKEITAILINDLKEIKKHLTEKINTIFIDEANFLKGDVKFLLELSIVEDLDIFIAGLNLTSELDPFGIMPQLLAVADEIELKKGSCNDCNRDAIYTYYDGTKKKAVLVGNDNYLALCASCLRKRKK